MDLGRAMYYREAVANAARQAVQAATYGDTSTGTPAHSTNAAGLRACQLAGGAQASLTRNVPDSTGDAIATIVNEAALESSSDGTPAGSILNNGTGGGATTMTITWNCNVVGVEPVTDAGAASTDPGTTSSAAVKARVVYRYSPVTTLFNRLFSAPISIVSTALGYNQF